MLLDLFKHFKKLYNYTQNRKFCITKSVKYQKFVRFVKVNNKKEVGLFKMYNLTYNLQRSGKKEEKSGISIKMYLESFIHVKKNGFW